MLRPVANRRPGSADPASQLCAAAQSADDFSSFHERILPISLAIRKPAVAQTVVAISASKFGSLRSMAKRAKAAPSKKPPSELKLAICGRLRAIQAEVDKTQEEMAALVGVTRQSWSHYIGPTSAAMPAEEAMILLCQRLRAEHGITMDWIYRGVTDCMPTKTTIRLMARLQGLDPDMEQARAQEKEEALTKAVAEVP